jgi:fructose/tagatose bisphosphate aldolase
MPVISKKADVLDVYKEAAQKGWVLPCFCSENLTTTEAVLEGTREHGASMGLPDLPVIVAITSRYSHRPQAAYYTNTRRWDIGLRLFLADLAVLAGPGSPFENLRIMIHLDHIQFDDDQELLDWDMDPFSSIMYDASKMPFADNMSLTQEFVRENGSRIVIEGACDEIVDASGTIRNELTTADKAETYLRGTGVDLIVANLGTEHRASSKNLQYHGDLARQIKARIGPRIVLHGASSVPGDQIARLAGDGICKVNLWTALERDSSPALFKDMALHACEVAGPAAVEELMRAGCLGEACSAGSSASLDYFTTTYRQGIVFHEMKSIVRGYMKLWYKNHEPART